MKRLLLLLTATALCSATLCTHAAEPQPSTATYQTRQGMMSATGTRTLERTGDGQWLLTSRAKLMLMELVERSQFTLVDGKVRPLRYEYINPFSRKRSRDLRFDWATQQVTETRGGHIFALEPATLDRLTIQLQSQLDLCAAPDAFERRAYAVADRRNIKHYVMEKVGAATLDTAVGRLDTIELKRYREGHPDEATRIWVAPQWNCLLVRLEESEEGEQVTLTLQSASIDGRPVRGR